MKSKVYILAAVTLTAAVWLMVVVGQTMDDSSVVSERNDAPKSLPPNLAKAVNVETIDIPLPSGSFRGISQRVVIVNGEIQSATVTVER